MPSKSDKPPIRLPPGPMPEYDQALLTILQILLCGETSVDVVSRRGCFQCSTAQITDRHFRTPAHLRFYFIFGMCQTCQDKMYEKMEDIRRGQES